MPRKKKTETAAEETAEPKKAAPKAKKAKTAMLDVMDPDSSSVLDAMRDSFLAIQGSKSRRNLSVRTVDQVKRDFFWVDNIHWQWMTGCCGVPQGTFVEIYGPTGAGKTSYAFWLIGHIMRQARCPVLYLNTEPKPMPASRASRFLSSDAAEAEAMMKAMLTMDVHSLTEMDEVINTWLDVARGAHGWSKVNLDKGRIPLLVVVDTLSMLMPPAEERGFYDHADNMYEANKKKFKDTGEASNLSFAQFMAQFVRRISTKLATHGATFIFVHHPSDAIDMEGASAARFRPQQTQLSKDLSNVTSIGGRAPKRLAAIQYVLTPKFDMRVRDPKTKEITGRLITMSPHKNSDGPTHRSIDYELREEHAGHDDPSRGYLDPGIHTEEQTAAWMVEKGLLGVTGAKGVYSCPQLGLEGVSSAELVGAIHADRPTLEKLGLFLGITGYGRAPEEADVETEEPTPEGED